VAQKKDSKKSDAKKPASKKPETSKAHVKKAHKALAKAEKTVQAAKDAVRSSAKKLRKKASALSEKIEKLAATQAKAKRAYDDAAALAKAQSLADQPATPVIERAVGQPALTTLRPVEPKKPRKGASKPAGSAPVPAEPPAVTSAPTPADEASVLTPPLPTAEAPAPTLIELREQARAKGLTGYSRLNKAALVEALKG
jgi:peptidoglycan hydrolase CwlO-like protein